MVARNVMVSFQVLPGGLADKTQTYDAVDAAIQVVMQSGLPYEVHHMDTTLEGDYDTVMAVIKQAQEATLAAGAARVFTNIKVNYDPQGSAMDTHLERYR